MQYLPSMQGNENGLILDVASYHVVLQFAERLSKVEVKHGNTSLCYNNDNLTNLFYRQNVVNFINLWYIIQTDDFNTFLAV